MRPHKLTESRYISFPLCRINVVRNSPKHDDVIRIVNCFVDALNVVANKAVYIRG